VHSIRQACQPGGYIAAILDRISGAFGDEKEDEDGIQEYWMDLLTVMTIFGAPPRHVIVGEMPAWNQTLCSVLTYSLKQPSPAVLRAFLWNIAKDSMPCIKNLSYVQNTIAKPLVSHLSLVS
jgi:hypothetical protein